MMNIILPGPKPLISDVRQSEASPVWIGRTDDGQVACVIVDFQLHPTASGE
ncbi:hypothetical protein [Streptomyces sp. NPDC051546]|uniref:hypothetical protein n=1 Tax=Streptomyces sp. NPDC051546 TaxID=3365655 RepID=UPI0037877140